ncbi:MAG: hypothetical protein QXL89_08835, partial [Nitrososphaeria archaeon]
KLLIGLGVFFIIIGIAFIAIPMIAKLFSSIQLEKIPWILLWIYKSDGFWFATSPILIIIGIIYLIWIFTKLYS